MKRPSKVFGRVGVAAFLLMLLFPASLFVSAEVPSPEAVAAYGTYCAQVEARLARQHESTAGFLVRNDDEDVRLRKGEFVIEQLTPAGAEHSGALLHHWRASAFAPGATAQDFIRLMQDVNAYPQHFAPQVLVAKARARNGDKMRILMRVRQTHVITVVLDTSYDVSFGRLDAQHGYSSSHSTDIQEVESPGTPSEHRLDEKNGHGFLWRQNTYWSYEERDGGLYLQVESVSLTRAIPFGLDWVIGPYVKSVPRESLEFTLRSVVDAIHH